METETDDSLFMSRLACCINPKGYYHQFPALNMLVTSFGIMHAWEHMVAQETSLLPFEQRLKHSSKQPPALTVGTANTISMEMRRKATTTILVSAISTKIVRATGCW
ncbi:hypothetical protein COCNU_scaffold001459G000010 [Cocos nucifera]|nr:hypothetical protein [Cocos nucifera]